MRRAIALFGYVRTFVVVLTLAVTAGAMRAAEFPPEGIIGTVVVLGTVLWLAPYGAKFRRNF